MTRSATRGTWTATAQFDDSTSPSPSSRCGVPARPPCRVRVTDTGGLSSTNSLGIEITEPATTLTFTTTEDARVEKNHLNTNYGASDRLRAALGPGMESYLRFQVSGIAGRSAARS